MTSANIVGYVAGTIGSIAGFPQLYKTIKSGHARDLSLLFLLMVLASSALWIAHGIMVASLPIILPNIVIGLCYLGLAYLKARDRSRDHEHL